MRGITELILGALETGKKKENAFQRISTSKCPPSKIWGAVGEIKGGSQETDDEE